MGVVGRLHCTDGGLLLCAQLQISVNSPRLSAIPHGTAWDEERLVGEGSSALAGKRRSGPENAPANELGMRRIMFTVDDVDDVVSRLRGLGGELVGEIAQYGDSYRLCFLRGPEGIIIGLAEELG
jgi:predicted enzyme related to lactoylglutathione lyase